MMTGMHAPAPVPHQMEQGLRVERGLSPVSTGMRGMRMEPHVTPNGDPPALMLWGTEDEAAGATGQVYTARQERMA